jgi:nicotinamide mononucleotide transporter
MQTATRLKTILTVLVCSVLLGYLTSRLHILVPAVFTQPASYPYADSFITVASIAATVLLARRYIENWVLWILNDIVCIVVYFAKDIRFIGVEYIALLFIAAAGLINWLTIYRSEARVGIR